MVGKTTAGYTADSIKIHNQHDQLLTYPELTFGGETGNEDSPYSSQKTVAIREIVDNATDEIRSGYGNHVDVTFAKDGSITVKDDGRGIPPEVREDGLTGIYAAMGIINSGEHYDNNDRRRSAGQHGVGGSSLIHMSKRADITVFKHNKIYSLSFKDGTPGFFKGDGPDATFEPLKDLSILHIEKDGRTAKEKKARPTGSTVKFWINDSSFSSSYPPNDKDIIERIDWVAGLDSRLHARVLDEWQDPVIDESYHYDHEYVDKLDMIAPNNRITGIECIKGTLVFNKRVRIDGKYQTTQRHAEWAAAFCWNSGYDYRIYTFSNTVHTVLGGSHKSAFENALRDAMLEKLRSSRGYLGVKDPDIDAADTQEGLTAILSVQMSSPHYDDQTKQQLKEPEFAKALAKEMKPALMKWLNSSRARDDFKAVAEKIMSAYHNRRDLDEKKAAKRLKNAISSTSRMPTNLVDCKYIGDEKSELHICEGRSAMGGLKPARDARYQAIFPIRGKIINVYKNSHDKIMANEEVQGIIACLGAGLEDNFDVDKMRYGKVIFSTDADIDGYAIQNLLLALFWKLFRPVIDDGRLYVTYPPLFLITLKDRNLYALDGEERDRIEKKLHKEGKSVDHGYTIERNKGLGTMNPKDARYTLMNPEKRRLKRLTANDVAGAEKFLTLAMDKDSSIRRDWIMENFDDIDKDSLDV